MNNADLGEKSRLGVSLLEEEDISEVSAPKPSGDSGKTNSVEKKEALVEENACENQKNFPAVSNLKKKTLYPIFVPRSSKQVGTKRKNDETPCIETKKIKTNQSQEVKGKALKKKVFEPPVIKLM